MTLLDFVCWLLGIDRACRRRRPEGVHGGGQLLDQHAIVRPPPWPGDAFDLIPPGGPGVLP